MASKAKNTPRAPVHKVTIAEATRDVILYVLAHGKTWQFLVIMLSWWMLKNATMDDLKESARYLLHNSVFGWAGWVAAAIIMILSSIYISRADRASRRRIRELTFDLKQLKEDQSKVPVPAASRTV